jgi:hypothetical protein
VAVLTREEGMLAQGDVRHCYEITRIRLYGGPWACLWATDVLRFSSERPTTRETDDARA